MYFTKQKTFSKMQMKEKGDCIERRDAMFQLRGVKYKKLHDLTKEEDYVVDLCETKKEGEKYTILSDAMFKAMFQTEGRKKYSCKLLSYLFEVEYEELLGSMVLLKNEVNKNKKEEKGSRCDYVAKIGDTYINIEVNNNASVGILLRNKEYMDNLAFLNRKRGKQDRKEDFDYVVQVNINNYAFKGNEKTIDIYMVRNEEGLVLDDHKIIVNIYIPNLRKKCYTKGEGNLEEIEKYLFVLIEKDIEESRKIGRNNGIMEEYIDEAIEVGEVNTLGESYDKEEALREVIIEQSEKKGIRKGIKEGERKKQIEIAKEMLKDGLDRESIQKYTKLSMDEIVHITDLFTHA